MAVKQVQLPDIGTVTLYKRRGNRSLRVSISPDGEVRVSLPYWLPYRAGEQFARSKTAWIEANRRPVRQVLAHGHAIGKAHRLHFEPAPQAARITTRVAANQVRVSFPTRMLPHEPAVQRAAQQAALRALRKEAEALLPQRLQALAAQTGLHYRSVAVKQLKSRWGSCTSDQKITLNIFLMQLPWHLIDYVLLHELAHTKVMQHGPPFWREMERHTPNARDLRKQMSAYQPMLIPRP